MPPRDRLWHERQLTSAPQSRSADRVGARAPGARRNRHSEPPGGVLCRRDVSADAQQHWGRCMKIPHEAAWSPATCRDRRYVLVMGSVYLEIRAGDPAVRELCEAYWAEDADGEFVQKVADLAAQHGLRTGAVAEVVRGHCTARLAAMACPDCGRGVEVASRADLQSRRHVRPGLPCADCRGRAEAEAQAAAAGLYERRRRMLHEHFAVTTRECTADNVRRLPLRTAVQHLALVRVAADEDLTLLRPQRVWPAVVHPRRPWRRRCPSRAVRELPTGAQHRVRH